MNDQHLPENLDEALGALKVIMACRVAELPLDVFEQLVGCTVQEYDKYQVVHYPPSRVFKEMYFVWIAKDKCVQRVLLQDDPE